MRPPLFARPLVGRGHPSEAAHPSALTMSTRSSSRASRSRLASLSSSRRWASSRVSAPAYAAERGPSRRRLEANRLELIRAQWALAGALMTRYRGREAA
jgi:hypothetical protein